VVCICNSLACIVGLQVVSSAAAWWPSGYTHCKHTGTPASCRTVHCDLECIMPTSSL
jgi:hypothetical protein